MAPKRFRCARVLLVLGLAWLAAGILFSRTQSSAQTESTDESDGPLSIAAESVAPVGSRLPAVLWVTYQGVIGSVTANYLVDAVDEAEQRGAACLVIEIDTPGGLDTSMRTIVKRILGSTVPVVLYVSPSGSRAASAGVFLALASNAIAMAPGTNMGAAHPVNLGGGQADSTLIDKATNDAVAYIRSLADQRGRDADWAEEAVRHSVSVAASEALESGLIDCIAADRDELFEKLDGMMVQTAAGEQELALEEVVVEEFSMSHRYRFLSLLNDPNVAYMLLLLGFYGLFFELSSPGVVLPGVVGAICLILGLFALQSFSINYAGLLLMLLGVGFFVAELLTPTYGVLSAGGVIALGLGSLLLFRSPAPFFRVSLSVMIPALGVTVAFFAFATVMAVRTRRKRPTTGKRALVGQWGVVRSPIDPRGTVFIQGTHWAARADEPVAAGSAVIVEQVEGLVLRVRTADTGSAAAPDAARAIADTERKGD